MEVDSDLSPLLAAWTSAFVEEYPRFESEDASRSGPFLAGGRAEMGAVATAGRAEPGFGEFPPERSGAVDVADESSGRGAVEVNAFLIPRLWLSGGVGLDQEGYSLSRAEVTVGISPIAITVGRGAIGYGHAKGGGLVIGEAAPLDRIGLAVSRPFALPGIASRLGTITFDTFLGRTRESRHPGDPFLWGASGSLRPHSRVTLAVHRGAFFGGGEDAAPITAGNLLNLLIGRVAGVGFENQIVSVEGVFRLPTESFVPLTAYLEWGAEDAAGAWWDVPGRIFGVYAPSVPGLPQVSVGLEHTSLAESCCFNPEWYRHWSFPGSWTLGGKTLGHPLGGHGTEWSAYTDVFVSRPDVHLDASAFRRDRGIENLFVPGREGASWGGDASIRWRIPPGREIFGSASVETGNGWREAGFSFGGRWFLR